MSKRERDIVGFHIDGLGVHGFCGLIVLAKPQQLAHCSCKRVVAFAVNRDGATRCIECDEQYVKEEN